MWGTSSIGIAAFLMALSIGNIGAQAQNVTCQTLRQCRVMRLLALRYYLPDQTASASLALTGGATGVASLDGTPLTLQLPQALNVTPTIDGSSANSGDSSYTSTITFTLAASSSSVTCTYVGTGTGFPPYDPQQANAYRFAACADAATGTSPSAITAGSVITVTALVVRVVAGGEQNSPNDPTAVALNITEPSTDAFPCVPRQNSDVAGWLSVGGNRRLGGEVLLAAGDDGVTPPAPVSVCSTIIEPTASATRPSSTSSTTRRAASTGGAKTTTTPVATDGAEWTSPLGSLVQTVAIAVVGAVALLAICLLAVCAARRHRRHAASKDLDFDGKPYAKNSGAGDQRRFSSDWSVDASRETMAVAYGSMQDFDAVYLGGGAADGAGGYRDYSDMEPPSFTADNFQSQQQLQQQHPDRTLMNTRAEIALPGFLKLDYNGDLRPDIVIAEGGGGIVYQAELLDDRLRQKHGVGRVVVKLVKNAGGWPHQELLDHFRQEVSIMWSLNFHEHVIKLVGYSEEPMAIVTRLYSRSLLDLIQDPHLAATYLDTATVLRFAYHICVAMEEIHSLGIAHRDVKAANLLIELPPAPTVPLPADCTPPVNDTAYWKVIVCDFGLAKVLGEADVKASKFSDVQGISIRYAAPEVFAKMYLVMAGRPAKSVNQATKTDPADAVPPPANAPAGNEISESNNDDAKDGQPLAGIDETAEKSVALSKTALSKTKECVYDDKAADVYAFSMIVWEMITHSVCWQGLKNDEIEWNVRNGLRPEVPTASDESDADSTERAMAQLLIKIMQDAWHQEPARRTPFDEIREELEPSYEKLRKPDWSLFEPVRPLMRSSLNSIAMYKNGSRMSMQQHQLLQRNQSMLHNHTNSARNSGYFHAASNTHSNRNSMMVSHSLGVPHQRARTFGSNGPSAIYGQDSRRSRHVTASGAIPSVVITRKDDEAIP